MPRKLCTHSENTFLKRVFSCGWLNLWVKRAELCSGQQETRTPPPLGDPCTSSSDPSALGPPGSGHHPTPLSLSVYRSWTSLSPLSLPSAQAWGLAVSQGPSRSSSLPHLQLWVIFPHICSKPPGAPDTFGVEPAALSWLTESQLPSCGSLYHSPCQRPPVPSGPS